MRTSHYMLAFCAPNSECVCIHLKTSVEKFYLLCLMTRKLFTFAKQECMEENPDSITFQEVLTPGQLYLMFLKVTSSCLTLFNLHMAQIPNVCLTCVLGSLRPTSTTVFCLCSPHHSVVFSCVGAFGCTSSL